MAYGDFTFNGVHCATHDCVFIVDSWPAAPSAGINKASVGGRHGTVRYSGRFYKERSLTGTLYFLNVSDVESSYNGMVLRGAAVTNWLCPEGRKQLIMDATPDRFYIAEIAEELTVETGEWPGGQMKIPFIVQPFVFSTAESTASAQLAANTESSVSLTVSGNRPAPLNLTFTALATVTWLQMKVGIKLIRLEGMSLSSGQIVTVSYDVTNNELMTVTVAGAAGMRYLTAESVTPLEAEAGANTVKLKASGAGEAVIRARGRWL